MDQFDAQRQCRLPVESDLVAGHQELHLAIAAPDLIRLLGGRQVEADGEAPGRQGQSLLGEDGLPAAQD